MPVQIGAKSPTFNDPTGLLSDCHRRIEMFLGSLQAVANVIDQPPTEKVTQALETALRYFSEAAPKHTADEEESLFPRLRQISNPEVANAFAGLRQLEQDHRRADQLHAEVERLGRKYLSDRQLSVQQIALFRATIRDLRSMYERHIAVEDNEVFPLATRLLNDQDKSAIAGEMAGRRKVELVNLK